jgi:hypothetical protein
VELGDWEEEEVLDALRRLLKNPTATWTSNLQQDAIMAVANTNKDILAILTTGSGKSMLSLIPAIMEHNLITVLILPLKSLIMDYKRKLEEMDVPYLHYSGRHTPRGHCAANLVIVSVEMAREDHWRQWLAEVDTVKRVQRFCFDEGHYPLTDANFRHSMRNIFLIRTLPRPLVVFSGTISPTCEPAIKEMFMLYEDVCVFRSPCTNRPEFQLIKAVPQSKSDVPEIVKELWTRHSSDFSEQDRALVFVPFLDFGHAIASKLGCQFYNSDDSEEQKQQVYSSWRSGECKIMISTSAFSCGNDYAHVRLVIHAGTPRQMIGYIQEISRGGRDKKKTSCYLLPISQWSSTSSTELDDLLGVKEMEAMCFGTTKECIRYQVTKYNDGRGVRCGEDEKNHPCSFCQPNVGVLPLLLTSTKINPLKRKSTVDHPEAKAPKLIKIDKPSMETMLPSMAAGWKKIEAAKQAIFAEDAKTLDALEINLNLVFGDCAMCFWTNQLNDSVYVKGKHEFRRCKFHQSKSSADYIKLKNLIHYDSKIHHKICYICHVPNFGEKLHGPFKGPGSCQYIDIILPTLYFGITNYKAELEKEFKMTWPTLMHFGKWLCSKPVKEEEKSNLVTMYLVICNKYL